MFILKGKMMNKWKRTFVCVIIIMMLNIFPSYAETDTFYWNGVEFQDYDNNSTILPEDVKQFRGMVRGEVISTGLVSIKNQGDRKATLIIQTLAHVRCDRICNTLILQKWNESDGDWEQILSYDFEALQKDNPDEDLTMLMNGVDVENLQVGTYRARGLHAVYLGDVYEGYASKTEGIQITK